MGIEIALSRSILLLQQLHYLLLLATNIVPNFYPIGDTGKSQILEDHVTILFKNLNFKFQISTSLFSDRIAPLAHNLTKIKFLATRKYDAFALLVGSMSHLRYC